MKVVILIFIYKITNNINGKMYIGQTIRPIEKRFNRHIRDAERGVLDTHFARAIRKYGSEHFQVEELDIATTQDELNAKERYWIQYFDSINAGYNETDALDKCGGNTYMSKSDEELDYIGEKIRSGKMGARNPNAKSIKCLNVNTGQELQFDTVAECKQFFNEKNHRFITTRVTHKIRGLYKNEWKIAYSDDEYGEYHSKGHRRGTRVVVEDMETGTVSQFDSIRSISKQYGIQRDKLNVKKFGSEFTVDKRYKVTVLS